MTGILGIIGCLTARPITASGSILTSGPAPGPVISSAIALTVPVGNPGQIKFTGVSHTTTEFTYSKNGGANTAITEGLIVSVANGDSISTRISGGAALDNAVATIVDPNATGSPTVAAVSMSFT